jgi:hypothetical protein
MQKKTAVALAEVLRHEAKQSAQQKPKKVKPKVARANNDAMIKKYMALSREQPVIKVSTDEKGKPTTTVERPVGAERDMARQALGNKPVRAVLCQSISATSGSANTVYAPVLPADITLTNNWTSWVSLFDEVRIDRCCAYVNAYFTASGTTTVRADNVWTMSCDPDDVAAETSIQNAMIAPYHTGPHTFGNFITLAPASAGIWPAKGTSGDGGLVSLRSPKLPRSSLPPNSGGVQSVNPVRGDWTSCVSASIVGCYYKLFFEAAGANVTAGQRTFITYEAEFRFRG